MSTAVGSFWMVTEWCGDPPQVGMYLVSRRGDAYQLEDLQAGSDGDYHLKLRPLRNKREIPAGAEVGGLYWEDDRWR